MVPSTGGEMMSDIVRMKQHAITIPTLTPADRILEATKQLKDAITQQPVQAPMDEIAAIELLREVMLGESKSRLPMNSVQQTRLKEKQLPIPELVQVKERPTNIPPQPKDVNYVSDDKDSDGWDMPPPAPIPGDGPRRSRRVMQ